jgi:acetolactate synthase regulatory subunit
MNIKLNISIHQCEGALIRLLGTIERRGHRLLGLKSRVSGPAENVHRLVVDIDCGERSPDVLIRQLERLYDVISIGSYARPEVIIDRHHLSFHAALPSLSGCFEPVRRATHG